MFDPQTSDEPPPPSYELSQETFDQKTQQGIQASLEPQDPLEGLWEEWDEAKFEANARSHTNPSASSSSSAPSLAPATAQEYPKEKAPRPPSPLQQEEPAVRPLKIVKKSQTAAYKKAVEARSYQSGNHTGGSAPSDEGASLSRSFSVLSVGRRTPPPMFESIGPSYDGPQYEEVVMSYIPGNSRPSSPVSVLSADSYHPPALPPHSQMANSRPNTNMGMPPPPQPSSQYQPAPRPIQPQRPQYQQPRRRVGFDPMSAYRSKPVFTPDLEPTPEKVDPSAFYKYVYSLPASSKLCMTDY